MAKRAASGRWREKLEGVASAVACESAPVGGDRLERDCQAAIDVIRKTHRASISHFQRMLDWGYNHAALVVDTLESRGVIGPQVGMGSREILDLETKILAGYAD